MSEHSVPQTLAESHAWARLEDQREWFGRKAVANERRYREIKVLQLRRRRRAGRGGGECRALAHCRPRRSDPGARGPAAVGPVPRHLDQLPRTCERLKREESLFLARAGPYSRRNRERLLAENVERLISQGQVKWETAQEEALRAEEEEERRRAP